MSRTLQSGKQVEAPYFDFMVDAVALMQSRERCLLKLEPELVDKFSCSMCGECCQRPWWIGLPRSYVDKWYAVFDQDPSGRFRDPFIKLDNPTDAQYADMRRKPGSSECIFLLDDRSCYIHREHGAEALSHVCRIFPRYESWFGAFFGSFLLPGCPDVQSLIQAEPLIYYTIGEIAENKWHELMKREHPLGLYGGYLWLGLELDLINRSDFTPVQTQRRLLKGLRRMMDSPVSLSELNQILSGPIQTEAQTQIPSLVALERLAHVLAPFKSVCDYLVDICAGWKSPPELNPAEKKLLNLFLRRYLSYRALTADFLSKKGESFFYPSFFLRGMHLAMLQWLALFYREREGGVLTQEHLLRAANLLGYRYECAPDNAAMIELSPRACLEGLEAMLSFDFVDFG